MEKNKTLKTAIINSPVEKLQEILGVIANKKYQFFLIFLSEDSDKPAAPQTKSKTKTTFNEYE